MTRANATPPNGQVPHAVRLTLHGTISTAQTWSTSFWFGYANNTTTPSASDVATAMTGSSDLEGYIDVLQAALSGYMAANTSFTTWSVTVYGESGSNPSEGYASNPFPQAGSSSVTLPPECALVASLITAQAGASYRGRSYLPLTGVHIGNDGLVPTATAQAVATVVAAFLSSVNAHAFDGPVGTNFSIRSGVNSVQAGVITTITSVRVDTRMDAQRRREDKLPGLKYSASVTD